MNLVNDEETPPPSSHIKYAYMELDPQLVRAIAITIIGGCADMGYDELRRKRGDDDLVNMIKKAKIDDNFGGAKIAFIIARVLMELFTGVLKYEKRHAEILMQMILNMALNSTFELNKNLSEGPKREG